MPRVPSLSPATGNPVDSDYIHTVEGNFVDSNGRVLLLRGVNLSGSSKAPEGHPSYLREELWEAGESGKCSFEKRPLNLEDGSADTHLARLKGWGFNMLRFPVTWEALEHEGPGIYDYNFMDYTIKVLQKCKEYGFKVFIDPHQDIWSRYSGGSGAPYWTLLACGINPRNFTATQAAILHCEYPSAEEPDSATLPAMIWSTNYGRLASLTLFTLFFGGRDYAPKCVIDGVNIQDYLQSHFIAAFGKLADRIRDAGDLYDSCVIGWDSMNEPAEGFCGWEDLEVVPDVQGSTLRKGSRPTPAQSFRLGMGQAQTVEHWAFGSFGPRKDGTVTIDPKGYKMWLDPEVEPEGRHPRYGWTRSSEWELGICIWALHGIWDIESGYVLRPDYFKNPPFDPERPVVFVADYWRPHWRKYAARIRESHPEAIHFIQPPVFAQPAPPASEADELNGRGCFSGHYYDGLTLLTRHWNWFNADALGLLRGKYSSIIQAVKIGETAIRKSLREQLAIYKIDTEILGPYPTLIGEIGIPYDMDGKRSYGWTDGGKYDGDYSRQEKALDASLNAADGPNALNYTIWTYCADNSHEWGDGWNMEDLSLWSADDLRSSAALETYNAQMTRSSTAAFLNTKSSVALMPMGNSNVNTSKMSVGTEGSVEDEVTVARPYHGDWINLYDFLTDGARAVRAFARPYPVATVGLPINIEFDIKKTEFKLTVRVRSDDVQDIRTKDGYSEIATEIFLPVVHFANDDLIRKTEEVNQRSDSPDRQLQNASRRESETNSLSNEQMPSVVSTSSSSSATLSQIPAVESLIDVDVTISSGRYEIEGQLLRWYYPIPTSKSDDEEEGPFYLEHDIRITRARGPIKTSETSASSSTLNIVSRSCKQLCGEGCVIM